MNRKVKFVGIKDPENDESVLGIIPISEKTRIFARVNEYKGKLRLDIRKWYWATESDAWMPSKGINIEVAQVFPFTRMCKDVLNDLIIKGYETGHGEYKVKEGFDND